MMSLRAPSSEVDEADANDGTEDGSAVWFRGDVEGDAEKGAKDAEGLDGVRRELAEADARHLLGTDGEEDEGEGLVRTIDDAAALDLGDEGLGDAATDVFGNAALGVFRPVQVGRLGYRGRARGGRGVGAEHAPGGGFGDEG